MQLNLSTDYAIRAVLYLSTIDRSADSTELSEVLCVPQHYLLNLCAKLRKAGLLASVPGHGGGIRLAKPADEICLADVISVLEPNSHLNRCLAPDQYCSRNAVKFCPVHDVYLEAQNALDEVFRITFAELVRRGKEKER